MTGGRVLLLAGTTEARELAGRLVADRLVADRLVADDAAPEVVASLAGVTADPEPYPCPVRRGPFGGPAALADELRQGGYTALIDASHPFAARLPHEAATAATEAGVPRLRLLRPPWEPGRRDRWHGVADLGAAAAEITRLGARRAFLAVGRQSLTPFAGLDQVHLVVRAIEEPALPPGATVTVLRARGPFDVTAERALLASLRVDVLVTKNSGGAATEAKLTAARELGLPVVMVDRPPAPDGPLVTTVEAALAWALALEPVSPTLASAGDWGRGPRSHSDEPPGEEPWAP